MVKQLVFSLYAFICVYVASTFGCHKFHFTISRDDVISHIRRVFPTGVKNIWRVYQLWRRLFFCLWFCIVNLIDCIQIIIRAGEALPHLSGSSLFIGFSCITAGPTVSHRPAIHLLLGSIHTTVHILGWFASK